MTEKRIAIVWRGALGPLPEGSRLWPVVRALEAAAIAVMPVAYDEARSADVEHALRGCGGVLAWVDPLDEGRDRTDLDAMLRRLSAAGVWIGSHPDTILKMGTKAVLFDTRHLGWGGDTHLYQTVSDFRREFPARLSASGVRVLKRHRGNGGQGVWKVALRADGSIRLQEATHRDATASEMSVADFMEHCEAYFEGDGRLIDQAFQPRISDGMVRCYLSGGTLVGFARQFAPEGAAPDDVFGIPGGKTMLPPDEPHFQNLRHRLEAEWVPKMQTALGIADAALPALWDADFLFGPKSADGEDSFVLCEINASCITPFPPAAPEAIAARATLALSTS